MNDNILRTTDDKRLTHSSDFSMLSSPESKLGAGAQYVLVFYVKTESTRNACTEWQ